MERKACLLALLKQANEMEMNFVDALPDRERALVGVLEDWSAKDVISHITARKALMADGLLAVAEARTPIGGADLDQENAILFVEYHDKSWGEVLELAAATLRRVVEHVERLDKPALASRARFFPWQGERPLWRLIVGSGCIHPVGHIAEFYGRRGEQAQAGQALGEMTSSLMGLDDGAVWQGEVKYNLACQYALLGATAEAVRELRESLALNPELADWARQDPDLDAIRGEPEYQALF